MSIASTGSLMLEDGRRHCATVVLTLRGCWGQAGSWSSVPDDHLSMMVFEESG